MSTPWLIRMFILLRFGVKGACKNFNRGLDCDVLVAEVGEELSSPKILKTGITSRISPLRDRRIFIYLFTSCVNLKSIKKIFILANQRYDYRKLRRQVRQESERLSILTSFPAAQIIVPIKKQEGR